MKRIFILLLAFLLLSGPAALAEENPAAGAWYAGLDGIPVVLSLNPDSSYTFSLLAAPDEPSAGSWTLEDGFVRLSSGSVLNLVDESLLIWTENGLLFTREPAETYTPAGLLAEEAAMELYSGAWTGAYLLSGGSAVRADLSDENILVYVEQSKALLRGGPFGYRIVDLTFENGAFTYADEGMALRLELQQDGFLRLTVNQDGQESVRILGSTSLEDAEAEPAE